MNKTIGYYDQKAVEYFEQTFSLDNVLNQKMFLEEIRRAEYKNPKMLDVGCGACRDTLFFKSNGIDVLPIDGSKEIAKVVKERLNIDVEIMDMSNMGFNNEFDIVWASASILHLSKEDAKRVMRKCYDALKHRGLFYISVKAKQDEEFLDGDRFFAYYSKNELLEMLKDIGFSESSFWYNSDSMGRPTIWLNFVVQKI